MTLARHLPSFRRARRLVQRNLIVYKHIWMTIFSGFFEPVFYLFGIGLGLGSMVREIGGVGYGAFVTPGLLAASCMNGAVADGFFNIFFKLHYQKTYDGILATPMRVADVAFGELLWALTRGSLYAGAFLIVVDFAGYVTGSRLLLSAWALLAFPAAVIVSAAFSSMALCVTSFARRVQDFDLVMGLLVVPMFLFSGIFFSTADLPSSAQWLIAALPMYHAVEMLRALTTGTVQPYIAVHLLYLVVTGILAFIVAMYRLERALIK